MRGGKHGGGDSILFAPGFRHALLGRLDSLDRPPTPTKFGPWRSTFHSDHSKAMRGTGGST